MSFIKALVLGAIQGLTEFLPVSSSGHLVIFREVLGVKTPGATFEVAVHIGTLVPVFVVFRRDILHMMRALIPGTKTCLAERSLQRAFSAYPSFALAFLIIVGTIPAGVGGLFLRSTFERMFDSLLLVGIALEVTAILIAATALLPKKGPQREIGFLDSLIIGVAQAVAITPGISRSGATISTAIIRRVRPAEAARFSFLLSLPALLAAAVVELPEFDLNVMPAADVAGAVLTSALVGYLALRLLIGIVCKGAFHKFAIYCVLMGLFAIAWGLLA